MYVLYFSSGWKLLSPFDKRCLQSIALSNAIANAKFPSTQCDPNTNIQCQRWFIIYDWIRFAATSNEETTQTKNWNGCETAQPRRFHHLSVGIFIKIITRSRILPSFHQMDESWQGRFQIGRFKGRVSSMGHAQKQTGYELRNNGPSTSILLSTRHSCQSRWPTFSLPIRWRT